MTVDRVELKLRKATVFLQKHCANQTTFMVLPGVCAQVLFMVSRFVGDKEDDWAFPAAAATYNPELRHLSQVLRGSGFKKLAHDVAFIDGQVSDRRLDEEGELGLFGLHGHRRAALSLSCGLTFELSWSQRHDAQARVAKMYRVPPTGPAWHAVGSQLEQGVRPRCAMVAIALVELRQNFFAMQAEGQARTYLLCSEN